MTDHAVCRKTRLDLAARLGALGRSLPPVSTFSFKVGDSALELRSLHIPRGRRGSGTGFMARCLALADSAGLPTTLEADSTDESGDPSAFELARWYSRFGFELSHLDANEWVCMRREPRPVRRGSASVLDDYGLARGSDLDIAAFTRWMESRLSTPGRGFPPSGF